MTFTWQGRRLATANVNGTNLSFKYNSDGIRTQKTVNGVTTYFTLDGSKIISQKTGNQEVFFEYDATGNLATMIYNGQTYYYVHNLMGEIIALVDEDGNLAVRYYYDPWGEVIGESDYTGENIWCINPFRYKDYYYDIETGLYYLNSRYYDPATSRFINADGQIAGVGGELLGYNMFAYCFNNPINMSDSNGNWPQWAKNMVNVIIHTIKKAVKNITKPNKKDMPIKSSTSSEAAYSFANHVERGHITTPSEMLDMGFFWGKVGFSSTLTTQNKEPGFVYSYTDVGNDSSSCGVGTNAGGWLGANVGASTEMNIFVGAQVTPWVHGSVSLGLDGIGLIVGFDVGDTSYDFEIKGGWGLIIAIFAPQLAPSVPQTNPA